VFVSLVALAGDYLLKLEGRQEYEMALSARGHNITGICIIKTDETGSRGSVVNEFGVHALDFTLSADRKKVKLLNVIEMMDHWYVKRVVKRDLRYLFQATERQQSKGRRIVTATDDGTITLENKKYKLKYSFKPIKTEQDETAE